MEALDGAAKAAGITILNEVGLDPGIDHLTAMRIIDDTKVATPCPVFADTQW